VAIASAEQEPPKDGAPTVATDKTIGNDDVEDGPENGRNEEHSTLVDPIGAYWTPLSESLAESGLTVELNYSSDFFTNARGGFDTNSPFQYRGLLDVGITLETEPLGLWKGGVLYINFIDNHGRDITERHIGDLQAVNNADAPNDSRIYEAWYQQSFLDDRFRIKVGRMDVNSDFAAGIYRDEFINSSPGFSPTIPMVTWPDTAFGAVLFVEPTDWLYFGAGVYDALGVSSRTGFDSAFHSPDETFTIAEIGIRPNLSIFGQENLPGQYSVGGFYHSGEWDVFINDLGGRRPPRSEAGNAGVYVTFDQLLYREDDESDDGGQGLGAFFQFGWLTSDRNEITQHYGAGFQYYGLIPSRDDDILGLGVHHASLSGRVQSLEDRHSETAIELFYKAQITDWWSLKPDVQYIVNPGGEGRNSIVFGVRAEFSL
jgi:porin